MWETIAIVLVTALAPLVRAQSCYETIQSLLATGTVINPYTVLTQLQYHSAAITSGAVDSQSIISQFCASSTSGEEALFCSTYAASNLSPSLANYAASRTIDLLIDCTEAYIAQSGDYTFSGSMYDFSGFTLDGTPPVGPSQRAARRDKFKIKREADFEEDFHVPIELTALTAKYLSSSSKTKSKSKRQASTCAGTQSCFSTCPYCAVKNALCSPTGVLVGGVVCNEIGDLAGSTLGVYAVNAACLPISSVCGPLAVGCVTACIAVMPRLVRAIVTGGCGYAVLQGCNYATGECTTCNRANNNVCNEGTTQCCPGETGRACGRLPNGTACCCCPACQAPAGPDCACQAAPC